MSKVILNKEANSLLEIYPSIQNADNLDKIIENFDPILEKIEEIMTNEDGEEDSSKKMAILIEEDIQNIPEEFKLFIVHQYFMGIVKRKLDADENPLMRLFAAMAANKGKAPKEKYYLKINLKKQKNNPLWIESFILN